jgi:hypothetical protein
MPASIEIVRLNQAIQAFKERAPRDLPPEVLDTLGKVEKGLTDYAPNELMGPGKRAALQAQGTDGTGEHYSKAAKGPDGPSPGQREARALAQTIAQARGE